jgi:hypothetical protein
MAFSSTSVSTREASNSEALTVNQINLPTRVITYAWGERYVDMLLSLTLPALLASGNLPYVASTVPCEFVILTEHHLFSRVLEHPSVRKLREICALRLIGIDDLVAVADKYGLTLTHALHRGFADLGPAMTDSWQIFFNADFIIADGGLRKVMTELRRGARLVAAPSYCVEAAAVLPAINQRVDSASSTLSFTSREIADLILQNLHTTIRGKMIDNDSFHMQLMDQFYLLLDKKTLLGHQMPIAIVGMRPERYVPEVNSLWDHGIIAEYCPTATPTVLGDSDDFAMLELRGSEVFSDQVSPGPVIPQQAAERMILWVTDYQRSFAPHQLTLHASDLPPGLEAAHSKLQAFMENILSYSPRFLPSHLDHPQWYYHLRTFVEARHHFLSGHLGSLTEEALPPAEWSQLDKAWWAFDGARKRLARVADARDGQLRLINDAGSSLLIKAEESLKRIDDAILDDAVLDHAQGLQYGRIYHNFLVSLKSILGEAGETTTREDAPAQYRPWYGATRERLRQEIGPLEQAVVAVEGHFGERITHLEDERARLEVAYTRMLPKRLTSAVTPLVKLRDPSAAETSAPRSTTYRAGRHVYHHLFGKIPRVTRLNPYWSALRYLIRLADQAAAQGARDVLLVGKSAGIAQAIADGFPGVNAAVSMAELRTGNLLFGFEQPPKFDLCICNLDSADLADFPEICKLVQPAISPKATIVGFYLHSDGERLPLHNVVAARGLVSGPLRTYYAGSPQAARALSRFRAAAGNSGSRLRRVVRIALMLGLVAPRAAVANWMEAAKSSDDTAQAPHGCVSITIEFVPPAAGDIANRVSRPDPLRGSQDREPAEPALALMRRH